MEVFVSKKCSCGMTRYINIKQARVAENGDPFDGAYFECLSCNSTMFVPRWNYKVMEVPEWNWVY